MAQVLLYGFPSQLVGITTRGDIQPRIASPLTGLDSLAAVNITMQSYDTLERLTKAAFTADQNTGTAMLEALSLQSVSRPVARVSELLTGHSITKAGQIVDNNVNFFELGTISRAFGTRPIEEIQAREAMHLDTVYGQADSRKRKEVTTQLKSYISNGNLDQEILADLNESYMRTGSAGGWRSAVNEAIAQAGRPGTANVREQLSPSSAVQLMMQDLD